MNTTHIHERSKQARRGGALLMTAVAISLVAALALCMVALQTSSAIEQKRSHEEVRAVLAAEAGLSESHAALQAGRAGTLASAGAPAQLGGGDVFVTTERFGTDNRLLRVLATAQAGTSDARAELVLRDNVDPMRLWGAFGRDYLRLSSQAKVDSYDSALGPYAVQVLNGSGSNAWARARGHVGSNGHITLSQNSLVFGNATPGPGQPITILGNATVSGSTAANSSTMDFAPIELPLNPPSTSTTISASTVWASGQHVAGSLTIGTGRTLMITGPATVIVDSLIMRSNSSILINALAGPVTFYVVNDFVMNSNTTFGSLTSSPLDLQVNLLSDNVITPEVTVQLDDVLFESNAKLYGTIYAPTAAVVVESNFELFGALIARRVDLRSNSRVHFDEALMRVTTPGLPLFERVSWRVLR